MGGEGGGSGCLEIGEFGPKGLNLLLGNLAIRAKGVDLPETVLDLLLLNLEGALHHLGTAGNLLELIQTLLEGTDVREFGGGVLRRALGLGVPLIESVDGAENLLILPLNHLLHLVHLPRSLRIHDGPRGLHGRELRLELSHPATRDVELLETLDVFRECGFGILTG